MKLTHEIFAIKLYELEQQYGLLQSRLRILGRQDRGEIRRELENAKKELREKSMMLQKSVEASRSPAVSELAAAQLEYSQRTQKLLNERMTNYLHSEASSAEEDEAEAAALYAEYAIDFATQAMQYALIASLAAMDLQIKTEERRGES